MNYYCVKDCPHIVEIYKHHLKLCKYIPRLYRSRSQAEVRSIIEYGKNKTDNYLKLLTRDLGYIYADADRRGEDREVIIANWIMNVIECQLL